MWLILSLLTAFFTATAAAFIKIVLKDNDELIIGWLRFVIAVPVFVLFFILGPKPHLDAQFWKWVLVLLPLELTAFFLYIKSLKISPISLTFPFLGLTPLFAIGVSRIILGETLKSNGIFGILLITLGAYLLNSNLLKYGVLEPVKNIFKEKGSMFMVIVALIYSVAAILGKKGVLLSSAYAFPLIYYPILTVIYTFIIFARPGHKLKKIHLDRKQLLFLLLSSAAFVLTAMFHFRAISMIQAPSMIAVKRVSLLISIIYGAVIFKEKYIKYRLLGGIVMLLGVAILAL